MTKSLIGLTQEELTTELQSLGVEKYRAKQIWTWVYFHGVKSFDDMNNISKDLRKKLAENYSIARPKIDTHLISKDGTQKWLLEFQDGEKVNGFLNFKMVKKLKWCIFQQKTEELYVFLHK